jgi:plasmid stabilization system protein ParE
MKLRFTPRATRDVADIADYIYERNPNAALAARRNSRVVAGSHSVPRVWQAADG